MLEKYFNDFTLWVTGIGTAITLWYNGRSEMLKILILFTVLDYVIGLVIAWSNKEVNSDKARKGFIRKTLNYVIVFMAYKLDGMLSAQGVMYTATVMFFISYEALSLLEHMNRFGVTFPKFIQDILEHIHNSSNEGELSKEWKPDPNTIVKPETQIVKEFLGVDHE